MNFDNNIRIQGRLDGFMAKAKRLDELLKRSLLLEEAMSGDAYKSLGLNLHGMSPDLVIPTHFNLNVTDSAYLLDTLLKKTDEEILALQTELNL